MRFPRLRVKSRPARKQRLARAANIYFRRYPFASDFFSKAGFLSDALAKETRIILYAFRSETIHYLENSAGFGVRWKLEIEDGHSVGLPIVVHELSWSLFDKAS